ncbi:MAG: PASTA domain-containing protein, partial [Acidimicrobiales bacterium]
ALAVLLVAVVAAAAAFAFLRLRVPSHEIPPLVGLTQGQAEGLIDDNGWDVEVFDGRQDGSTPGDVIAQDPAEGESLKEDETVRITVSLGNTMTDVPTDLPGKSLADAQVAIEAAGLVLGEPQRQLDEAVPGDVVISLAPDTKPQLPKGDPVVLVVSDGPAPRTVPAVAAGSTFEQAHAALAAVQLVAQRVEEFSDTVPVGQVIRIDPAAGASVPRDSAVNVVVSKGPELIPIPNVIGRTASEAAGILEQSGFGVAQVIGNPNRAVIATDPPPGELHRRGAQVTIVTRF